ncbi:MAG: hypothetical protein R6V46_18205 [Desulfatiglandaceae bacterium]
MGIKILAYKCMVLDRVFSSVNEAEKEAESLNRGFPDMIFLPFSESSECDLSQYSTIRDTELRESEPH